MASYTITRNYRCLINDSPPLSGSATTKPDFEFDESDIWGSSTRPDSPDLLPARRQPRRPVAASPSLSRRCVGRRDGAASSLPVNVPDWSKILRQEYGNFGGNDGRRYGGDGEEVEEEEEEWVPPHEYLAKTRIASFSVHEDEDNVEDSVQATFTKDQYAQILKMLDKQPHKDDGVQSGIPKSPNASAYFAGAFLDKGNSS